MLDRYRGKVGTFGLVIAIILASFSAYWLIDSATNIQSTYENAAKNRADDYSKRRDVIEKNRCLPLASKEEAACINQERESARQGYRDEYDLEAQRVTANWTAHMGIAAIIGMAASLIGVGLVFFTFRETQRTAEIAQANLDTYKDLEAGRMIPQFGFTVGNAVKLSAKNAGKSDAHVLFADFCLLPFNENIKTTIATKLSDEFLPQNISVPPNVEYPFPPIAIPTEGVYTLAGGVIYMDIFGRIYLCNIALDIVRPDNQSHSSTRIDFTKWERAVRDLQAHKTVKQNRD
jgi:hypothetical protein